MSNTKYKLKKNIDSFNEIKKNIDIGKCIKIINSQKNYQVIGFNPKMNICWVREWPIKNSAHVTFQLSVNNILIPTIYSFKKKDNGKSGNV